MWPMHTLAVPQVVLLSFNNYEENYVFESFCQPLSGNFCLITREEAPDLYHITVPILRLCKINIARPGIYFDVLQCKDAHNG
jgi:hypothetical protein